MFRRALAIAIACLSPCIASAQTANLVETPKIGDISRYAIDLTLTGNLIVTGPMGRHPIPLEAKAKHRFVERTITIAGIPVLSARYYDAASASSVAGGEKMDRLLASDRRLIIARQSEDALTCFAPAGSLSRDELELVSEHFNPHCLAGLLPGKAVPIGDTWAIGPVTARSACSFDSLIKTGLTGKLLGVEGGIASFGIEGSAEGLELGAKVIATVVATGKFDLATSRITEVSWKQTDDREAGPVSPASHAEVVLTLKREVLDKPIAELSDTAIATIPAANPPASITALHHIDPKGRYKLIYPRSWHITGQSDAHLILRLLEGGNGIAQATITPWVKAEAGKHASKDEFKKSLAEVAGWVPTKIVEEAEVPLDGGRWLYRVAVEGKAGESAVLQTFHLLAGPKGDQVAVTFSMARDQAERVGQRDLELVKAIELSK